jgi:uncharacterized delta-60 repeat protein
MRKVLIGSLLLIAQVSFGGSALAAPGDLDPTFSIDGRATVRLGPDSQSINAAAAQPDGKVVGVGYSYDAISDSYAMAVVRLRADGTLDPSFSGDGKLLLHIGFGAIAWDVAIQPDGRIVLVGAVSGRSGDGFELVRLNDDGSLDPTFGGAGKVFTDFGFESNAEALVLLPDGKILVAGTAGTPDSHQNVFGLARYGPDGTIDRSFGRNGKVRTRMGSFDYARDVAVGPDGRIVVVGRTVRSGKGQVFAVAVYTPQGALDRSFNRNGIALTRMGVQGFAESVVVQSDGRIVVGGPTSVNGFGARALVRFDPDGSLDPTFGGGDGKVLTHVSPRAGGIQDLTLSPEGAILAVGPSSAGMSILRYLPDGSLDASFGRNGVATVEGVYGEAISLAPSDRIVVAGPTLAGGSVTFARLLSH